MYKYYDKVSLFSRFINFLFLLSNSKKNYSSKENTQKLIEKLNKKQKKVDYKKYGLMKEECGGIDIYSYNGTLSNPKDKVLLYIHGGSFIEEAVSYQIKFAVKIAEKTNSTLILPEYLLIPKANYKTMYNSIYPLYQKLGTKEINLLGDSAGGGFILSFSMFLRDKDIVQPKNVIMMSPWLDVTLSNPELIESEKLDPMCSIEGNRYAGILWAGDLDTRDYLVSPMYGMFDNLPFITIITGGRDLLRPDCLLLSKMLKSSNIEHNYIEYRNQGHDFGAYPTKEGRLVIEDISKIIKGGE